MIDRVSSVRIQNYKCLRDVTVELEPLTALAGPNASGKSAILNAMDPRRELRREETWRASEDAFGITLQYSHQGRVATEDFRVRVGHSRGESRILQGFQLLRLDAQKLRQPATLSFSERISESGAEIPNVFHSLSRTQKDEIADRLRSLIPLYRDVDAHSHPRLRPGQHELQFDDRWSERLRFVPDDVSDGTLLLVALLLIPYQAPAVTIVGLEEPEHGIHPYLIENVVKMLRMLATEQLGPRAVQVILTTHSPTLLNFLEPREVRFLRREKIEGATVIEKAPVDSAEWAEAFKNYERELGTMWLSGGLGGVPGD